MFDIESLKAKKEVYLVNEQYIRGINYIICIS